MEQTENVQFIYSGSENLQSGMVDNGALIIRLEDLPPEAQKRITEVPEDFV